MKKRKTIFNFLDTKISKTELKAALKVIKEFKKNESYSEWINTPFDCWYKIEQLEEFLEYIVNKKPLSEDTKELLDKFGNKGEER